MHELNVLDRELGDLRITWDPENPDEVEAAENTFNDLREKEFKAYDVGRLGKKGNRVITKFDPKIEKMIMTPPVEEG